MGAGANTVKGTAFKMSVMKTISAAVGIMIAAAAPAFANPEPGIIDWQQATVGPLVYVVLLFAAILALSQTSGAYAILHHWAHGRVRAYASVAIMTAVAIGLSASHYGFAWLILPVVAVWGIVRGIKMTAWGMQTRSAERRVGRLADAKPDKLVRSGLALIILVAACIGLAYFDQVDRFRRNSRNYNFGSQSVSLLHSATSALDDHYARHKRYPASLETLVLDTAIRAEMSNCEFQYRAGDAFENYLLTVSHHEIPYIYLRVSNAWRIYRIDKETDAGIVRSAMSDNDRTWYTWIIEENSKGQLLWKTL